MVTARLAVPHILIDWRANTFHARVDQPALLSPDSFAPESNPSEVPTIFRMAPLKVKLTIQGYCSNSFGGELKAKSEKVDTEKGHCFAATMGRSMLARALIRVGASAWIISLRKYKVSIAW